MNRREHLQALLGLASVNAGRSHAAASEGTRPNILFIMADELRADCVGYTNPQVQTPHLNRLARNSVVFSNAYTTSPSCVPARAAIYTGRYPSQCGAPSYITYLPERETTFMKRLQAAGYYTAAIGKQHFGESRIARGYDYQDLIDFEGDRAKQTSYGRMLRQSSVTMSELRQPAGRFVFKWTGKQAFHIDEYVGNSAKSWLREQCPKDQPWFLTVSFHGPHQPFDGLGLRYQDLYKEEEIELPHTSAADLADKPPHFGAQKQRSGELQPDEIRRMRLSYFSKISLVDEKIGELLKVLEERGEYDRTLVVFTADHGDFMGDFGLVYKGQYLSEVLMRIPLLAKPPIAKFAGREENAFVHNFDIAPTSLVAAKVDVPREMAAQDLSPFWTAPDKAARRRYCFMDGHHLQGVRDDQWKLVHYQDRPYGELYDLKNDPWEKRNRWNDAGCESVRARLQAALINHLTAIRPRSDAEWNHGAPEI